MQRHRGSNQGVLNVPCRPGGAVTNGDGCRGPSNHTEDLNGVNDERVSQTDGSRGQGEDHRARGARVRVEGVRGRGGDTEVRRAIDLAPRAEPGAEAVGRGGRVEGDLTRSTAGNDRIGRATGDGRARDPAEVERTRALEVTGRDHGPAVHYGVRGSAGSSDRSSR